MCLLCEKAGLPGYGDLVGKMRDEDIARLQASKDMADEFRSLNSALFSSMSWPVKLVYPMFEARSAFAVPNNYFQNVFIDDERLGNSFAHGAMRSIFFAGERLVLFSKSVNLHGSREFFTSFLLLHLEKGEYDARYAPMKGGGEIRISATLEKPLMNLLSGKVERKRIAFTFIHQSILGKIVSKEQAAQSARFKNVYDKHGGAQMRSSSMDLEGYAITVPHFAPHPYMLQLHKEFGYEDNKVFQEHVEDYFKAHLGG